MTWFKDDGTAVVSMPITPEAWTAINAPNADPVNEVHRRGLDHLRMKNGMDEGEIAVVSSDGLYLQSCRTEYWNAKRTFDKHRKLPGKFKLEFTRPGTRGRNLKVEEDSVEGEKK